MADWLITEIGQYIVSHTRNDVDGYYTPYEPEGGNVLLNDGHVEWRRWREMPVRFHRNSPSYLAGPVDVRY